MPNTQLYFRYSRIYNETLATLVGTRLPADAHQKGEEFVERFRPWWNAKNDKVFSYYSSLGLLLPNFWLAYPVHRQPGTIPFSDPLTKEEDAQGLATLNSLMWNSSDR